MEKDFYTVKDASGNKDSVVEETLLRHWDGRGATILGGLLRDEFPLSEANRDEFAIWLGLQWLRGRAARQMGEELGDELMNSW